MGIDPNAKPDFFIDVENCEFFRDIEDEYDIEKNLQNARKRNLLELIFFIILLTGSVIFGYKLV